MGSVLLTSSVWRVLVLEGCQRYEAVMGRLEVGDADEDVDDGLRVKSGDAGAADVTHATDDPSADRLFQQRALLLEAPRPRRIGRNYPNGFIS